MKKSDIQTSYHQGCQGLPMINVKVRKFPYADDVKKHFPKASDAQLEKAVEWAWNLSQRMFWDDIQETAKETLGKYVVVSSEGRSGGWLVVHGLGNVESWNGPDVSKWAKFNRQVEKEIAGLCQVESVIDIIQENRWHEDGAEEYNYFDSEKESHCIVDLKASAKSKLSPIERKLFNL